MRCHHHTCQNETSIDNVYCEMHQYCVFPTCHERNEEGSFYCKEHRHSLASTLSKSLSATEPPERPLSGSVNIQIDYLVRLAQYWKEQATYWKTAYVDSRK